MNKFISLSITASLLLGVQAVPQGWNAAQLPAGWTAPPAGWTAAPTGWTGLPTGWGSQTGASAGDTAATGEVVSIAGMAQLTSSSDSTNLTVIAPTGGTVSTLGTVTYVDSDTYQSSNLDTADSTVGSPEAADGANDFYTGFNNEGTNSQTGNHTVSDASAATILTSPNATTAMSAGSYLVSSFTQATNGSNVDPGSASSGWGSGWRKPE